MSWSRSFSQCPLSRQRQNLRWVFWIHMTALMNKRLS